MRPRGKKVCLVKGILYTVSRIVTKWDCIIDDVLIPRLDAVFSLMTRLLYFLQAENGSLLGLH